jgi:hypothetical protein
VQESAIEEPYPIKDDIGGSHEIHCFEHKYSDYFLMIRLGKILLLKVMIIESAYIDEGGGCSC